MTSFRLAQLHPTPWHVTAADAVHSILERGPLTTNVGRPKNYAAVRRGLSTFAPFPSTDYESRQRQRGSKQPDKIKEIAVRSSSPDIARFVREAREGVPA